MLSYLVFLFLLVFSFSAKALINGEVVEASDPLSKSVVAIQMVEKTDDGSSNYYKGSGVVISKMMIMTAGHNFYYLPDPSDSKVIFSRDPQWSTRDKDQKSIRVKAAHVFGGFSQGPLGTKNDLAILELSQPIPEGYKPLKLVGLADLAPAVGEMATILGFGFDRDRNKRSFILRKISLPVARWSSSTFRSSEKMWVGANLGSIAGGDSGGPALFRRNGEYFVYGIAIHNRYEECVSLKTCEPQSAFSNLIYFLDWIEKIVGSNT